MTDEPEGPVGERTHRQRLITYSISALVGVLVGLLVYTGTWKPVGGIGSLLYVAAIVLAAGAVYALVRELRSGG